MNRCSNCNKILWLWNKFNREYGQGVIYEMTSIEYVRFCSMDCCLNYKENHVIDFNKDDKQ